MSEARTIASRVRPTILLAGVSLALVLAPGSIQAQVELCEEASRFVREVVGMAAVVEPDTIDDWRTRAMVPGCRVTAAGATRRSPADQARLFYEQVVDAGWARTPDPRDAPNEASLRYRRAGADCLFNFYTGDMSLNTEAEMTVMDAVPRRPGETIYNFLVMCTPEAPAAPRG